MNFWKALLRLLLQKRIGIPVALAAVGVAAATFAVIPVRYMSSTIMMVSPPVNGGIVNRNAVNPGGGGNPLLIQTEGLSTAVATLVLALSVEETRVELGAPKDGPTELVVNDGSTSPRLIGMDGPFLYVEATSTSAKASADVVAKARERLIRELDGRQRELGAPTATYVVLMDIVPPTPPESDAMDKFMGAAMGFVIAMFLGISIVYGLERRRARRRVARAPAVPEKELPREELPRKELPREEHVVHAQIPEKRPDPAADEDDMPTDSFPAVVAEETSNGNGKAKAEEPEDESEPEDAVATERGG
ncbi:hypothetical protein [Nonomuraea endophytica]|uniref:Polysaccharide chain length determinant N-terminal domain-containing protein n=1 Tax=Nonomuraea endophytica TaxID=714136 RepID=A0A7W7ZXU8_9ACTN|nr:hypothetical protein [Nonomuraea endophytica]MBB5075454.1 hypothetical protein [Nonomuraea endophytica]